jgi:hypothetical protein
MNDKIDGALEDLEVAAEYVEGSYENGDYDAQMIRECVNRIREELANEH